MPNKMHTAVGMYVFACVIPMFPNYSIYKQDLQLTDPYPCNDYAKTAALPFVQVPFASCEASLHEGRGPHPWVAWYSYAYCLQRFNSHQ